jgi:hypothetical protein
VCDEVNKENEWPWEVWHWSPGKITKRTNKYLQAI